MKMKVFVKRGHNKGSGSKFIPSDGELSYGYDTNEFFVGDGKTPISELNGFSNVCKAPNGDLYVVSVDNNGVCSSKRMKMKVSGKEILLNVPEEK